MKIGNYSVKHSYKPARIISDVLSLGITVLILFSTLNFFPLYKARINEIGEVNLEIVAEYRYSLTYRQYFAWIYPALAVIIFGVYLILILKNHRFAKYDITAANAQSVYDWYAFAVSLCKIPLLLAVLDMMYVFHQRMMFNEVRLFGFQYILYALLIVIVVRLSVHRIKGLTQKEKKSNKADDVDVKAKLADDDRK
ncbi:MAG: hypothetical protein MR364_04725 [Oscillospiraceae bacterium]|nr:hypothetical protein [Oscillospiraceae bacterium]